MKKIVLLFGILGAVLGLIYYVISPVSKDSETVKKLEGKLETYDKETEGAIDFVGYEGKYITFHINLYSSFLPELELTKDGEFTLALGIDRYLKGSWIKEENQILLTIRENTAQFSDQAPENIALKIEDSSSLIFLQGFPGVIKPSAVFKKVTIATDSVESSPKTLRIKGTKDGVETFLNLLQQELGEGIKKDVLYDNWFNITPQEVLEKTEAQIFKSSEDCASFLLYREKIYRLGDYFGGLGVVDIKVCDFNKDGQYELLYTHSWGSGLHRSHVSHMDLKSGEQTQLDYVHLNEDMMLAENPEGEFSLYEAKVEWGEEPLIDFNLTARKYLADIVYEGGVLKAR
ncbi:hypothetical protein [Cellulosilyticum sp. I15G10I2]|uniref:hypothetical protein n=1 Tax=Cellulosilyticum sp. I15G10I2 TaxID=1892843 RepID=UPI00085C0A7A|nr:hypothetical protein [Cellulosilyticum sp. I15G10I2]